MKWLLDQRYFLRDEKGDGEGDTPPTPPTEGEKPPVDPPPAPEMVSKSELDKVLADMHRYKSKSKELEDKIKNEEIEAAKKAGEWQRVAELKENEAKLANERAERLDKSYLDEKKYAALREEALRSGIRKEALPDLDLIDFTELETETLPTGRVTVKGADKAILKLKTLRPHWFGAKTPSVNANSPDVISPKKVSYADLVTAEKNAKATGDYKEYHRLIMEFKKQA